MVLQKPLDALRPLIPENDGIQKRPQLAVLFQVSRSTVPRFFKHKYGRPLCGMPLKEREVFQVARFLRAEEQQQLGIVVRLLHCVLHSPCAYLGAVFTPTPFLWNKSAAHRELRDEGNGRPAIRQTEREIGRAEPTHAVAEGDDLSIARKKRRQMRNDIRSRRVVPGSGFVDDEELGMNGTLLRFDKLLLRSISDSQSYA